MDCRRTRTKQTAPHVRIAPAVILLAALAAGAASGPVATPEPVGAPPRHGAGQATLLPVGEGEVGAQLLGIADGRVAVVLSGETRSLRLSTLREITFARGPVMLPEFRFEVRTTDGCILKLAEVRAGDEAETVDLSGYRWRGDGVRLEDMRALATTRFLRSAAPGERQAFLQAAETPSVGRDTVDLTRGGISQRVRCIVTALGQEGVAATVEGRALAVTWDELNWLVLAPLPRTGDEPRRRHQVLLACGSVVGADSLALSGDTLAATDGPTIYTVRRQHVSSIRIGSEAYRYLSDMAPAVVRAIPQLDVVWPPRMDASAARTPLSLGGRVYVKGIGMHACTAMAFDLQGRYGWFHATVGVDDTAGQQGSVIFRVLADGREVWALGPMAGGDRPQKVKVGIGGVRELALVADPGDALEPAGNFADWADARVVRESGIWSEGGPAAGGAP
jgi:hypothetical protein